MMLYLKTFQAYAFKVQTVTLARLTLCFGAVSDVVTGLPLSNNDHGINILEFLPNGQLLVGVAGTTNGGISVKNDLLGGIQATPYSGTIIKCCVSGKSAIKYTTRTNPRRTGC